MEQNRLIPEDSQNINQWRNLIQAADPNSSVGLIAAKKRDDDDDDERFKSRAAAKTNLFCWSSLGSSSCLLISI